MAKRRKPGDGYTRQEKNGTWTALYPKPGKAGGYYVKRGFATEPDADRWLVDIAARESKRYDIAGGEQTLDTLIDRWLDRQEEKVRAGKLKQRTWNDYAFKLGYARSLIGYWRVSELMPDHIDDAISIMGRKLAETTTRQIRALLHRILEDARKRRYIESNPVIIERGNAAEKIAPERLNLISTRALLRAAKGNFYELAWWLLLILGLRAGEVCGLRVSDIDRNALTITIAQTVADERGKPMLSTPKTKNSRRTLPFPRALLPLLDAHLAWLERRAKEGVRRGKWQSSALLFPGRGGRPMNTTSLYHQLQRLCLSAHLLPTKVHNLRHTAAKFYTDLHIEERYIAAILGHSPNITGHYSPPDADAMRPWVEQVCGVVVGDAEAKKKASHTEP